MSTITNRHIIETLLENDGLYPGDPQADSIFEYTHAVTGAVLWAVFYHPQHVDLHISPFVEDYVPLWDRRAGHLAPIGILERTARNSKGKIRPRKTNLTWQPIQKNRICTEQSNAILDSSQTMPVANGVSGYSTQ